MATLVKTAKNEVTLTRTAKTTNEMLVDTALWTIDEADGSSTVNAPKYQLTRETKNETTLVRTPKTDG